MKYTISGQMTVSCWTKLEANSKEEALKLAKDRANNELIASTPIFSGSDDVEDCFHFSNDGYPCDLKVE